MFYIHNVHTGHLNGQASGSPPFWQKAGCTGVPHKAPPGTEWDPGAASDGYEHFPTLDYTHPQQSGCYGCAWDSSPDKLEHFNSQDRGHGECFKNLTPNRDKTRIHSGVEAGKHQFMSTEGSRSRLCSVRSMLSPAISFLNSGPHQPLTEVGRSSLN